MLTCGEVVEVDLGVPIGSEAGLRRPVVVVTAERVLRAAPTVVRVVPLTRTLRGYAAEVMLAADEANGLEVDSAAQCQHIRAIATARVMHTLGNVGPVSLAQIRDTLAVLLDLWGRTCPRRGSTRRSGQCSDLSSALGRGLIRD